MSSTCDFRVILTPKGYCNYSCTYCHMEGFSSSNQAISITPSVIANAVNALFQYGISGVTISGGEPLLEIDYIFELLSLLKVMPITIITNGSLLRQMNILLAQAQIHDLRVIINVPSFNNETYQILTGQTAYSVSDISNNIRSSSKFCSVHLNCVLNEGINTAKSMILSYCNSAKDSDVELVRFIVQPKDSVVLKLLVEELGLNTVFRQRPNSRSIAIDLLPDQKTKIIICGDSDDKKANNDLYVTTDGRVKYGFSGKTFRYDSTLSLLQHAREFF